MSLKLPEGCADLARHQHGVISRLQALECGMTSDAIDRQLRYGRWQTLHRGVYAVFTGPPPREAILWAAVRRAGTGAALSHQTAAELFKLVDWRSALIHITIPATRQAEHVAGVVLHRSSRLDQAIDAMAQPPRIRVDETVLDLVNGASTFDGAFNIVSAAVQRQLATPDAIARAMIGRPKLRWRRDMMRALLDVRSGAHSFLEYRYMHRVERAHSLPVAIRQARVTDGSRNRYLDNLYGEFGLCVELDGLQAHPDDRRWQDQARTNAVAAQGIATVRYTWRDVEHAPCRTATQVASALRKLGWSGVPRACSPACPVITIPPPSHPSTRPPDPPL